MIRRKKSGLSEKKTNTEESCDMIPLIRNSRRDKSIYGDKSEDQLALGEGLTGRQHKGEAYGILETPLSLIG